MKNVTISLDDNTMEALRNYATARGQTLNGFLRDLVSRTVRKPKGRSARLFQLMDALPETKVGVTWTREELYNG